MDLKIEALTHHDIDKEKLIHCYKEYMIFSTGQPPTVKMFIANMDEKMVDIEFSVLTKKRKAVTILRNCLEMW